MEEQYTSLQPPKMVSVSVKTNAGLNFQIPESGLKTSCQSPAAEKTPDMASYLKLEKYSSATNR